MLQSFCATITPGFTFRWIYDGFRCLCLGCKLLDAMSTALVEIVLNVSTGCGSLPGICLQASFFVKMVFLGFFACMMVLWLFEIPLWVARFLAISWVSPSLLMGFVVV